MDIPEDLKFTKSHEWAKVEENIVTIGLSDYAQEQLGDIVYIELPEEGRDLHKEEVFGMVESVKAVSDIYSPVSGEVIEINDAIVDSPEVINDDPFGEAWLIKVRIDNPDEINSLMDTKEYKSYVEEESNK
jgi:glycine cleavage system H protein